jgi:hypothetical protein
MTVNKTMYLIVEMSVVTKQAYNNWSFADHYKVAYGVHYFKLD